MRPYYERGNVLLFHADCRDVLPHLPESVIVTDPPYGQSSLIWDRWQAEWLSLAVSESLWCFGSLRMFLMHGLDFTQAGWKLSQDIIWEKHNGSGFHADRFKRVHEQIAHFYKGEWRNCWRSVPLTLDAVKKVVYRKLGPQHMGVIAPESFTSVEGGPRLQRSVLHERSMHGSAIHPTEKPVPLLLPLIEYAAWPGALVVDPFAGSGAILEAAIQRGHPVVGIEAHEPYCALMAERLDKQAVVVA